MERKEGLKPCPFCGRTNQRFLMDMDIYSYPQNRGRRAIICDCGLRLYAIDHGEAEEKWQNRLYDEYIKKLTEENKRLESLCVSKDIIIGDLSKENERLRAEISVKKKLLDKCVALEDEVRADTVRKMQERFNEKIANLLMSPIIQYQASAFIDQIAKEIIEGETKNDE